MSNIVDIESRLTNKTDKLGADRQVLSKDFVSRAVAQHENVRMAKAEFEEEDNTINAAIFCLELAKARWIEEKLK